MRLFSAALTIVALTTASLPAAPIVTLTVNGVLTGDISLIQNTYQGPRSGFDLSIFGSTGTATPIAAGTPFTAEFVYDVGAMPAAIQSNAHSLDGSTPITTHTQTSPTVQWMSSRLQLAGHTFSTAAVPADVAPTGANVFAQEYQQSMAYGPLSSIPIVDGYFASSLNNTGYTQSIGPLFDAYFRSGVVQLYLYHSAFNSTRMLTGPGIPTSFQFSDTDLPFEFSDSAFISFFFSGFLGHEDFQTNTGDYSRFQIAASGSSLRVLTATASVSDVPEPSTFALAGLAGLLVFARRR